MSRAENEAYWGATDTAPQALDNFFDEDVSVCWIKLFQGLLYVGDFHNIKLRLFFKKLVRKLLIVKNLLRSK